MFCFDRLYAKLGVLSSAVTAPFVPQFRDLTVEVQAKGQAVHTRPYTDPAPLADLVLWGLPLPG